MLTHIFEPLTIGPLTLKNRLIVPAMVTNYCTADGLATERFIAYHEAKARGGWALIITEDYRIAPEAGASANLPGLYQDSQIASHRQLTDRVHQAGSKIIAQIYHAGWDSPQTLTGQAPSGVTHTKNQSMADQPQPLSIAQIQQLTAQFAQCARRVQQAGFDGVEIHGAHGYLINQFLSPLLNSRGDQYGGNFTGRTRFACEVVQSVRQAVGPDFPIFFRLSAVEYTPGGLTLEESKALAILLEDAGVNAINCSQGGLGCRHLTIPPSSVPPGAFASNARALKSVVHIPVATVGRINTPEIAEAILRSGQADLIAMGRASLADPQLPNKAQAGQLQDINHCIGCVQGCIGEKRRGRSMNCLVNPTVGSEGLLPLTPAPKPQHILIAGGGVSGCAAAIACALRGHHVTLYEKEAHLGGQWRLAAMAPGKAEFASLILWQERQLHALGVTVQLAQELTSQRLSQDRPDLVIIATGSQPVLPPIDGIHLPHVVTAQAILSGQATAGEQVVIIGGGLAGAETADYLALHGSAVTLLEALPDIVRDGEPNSTHYLLQSLHRQHVSIYTQAQVQTIGPRFVRFLLAGETRTLEDIDTVIIATGVRPYAPLADALESLAIPTVLLGDAKSAKNGFANIQEAFWTAANL